MRCGPPWWVAGPLAPLADMGAARATSAWTGLWLPGCGRPLRVSGVDTSGGTPGTLKAPVCGGRPFVPLRRVPALHGALDTEASLS